MGAAWRYWTHLRLEASGRLRRVEIEVAKAFFQQQFPTLMEAIDVPDAVVQQQLVQIMRSEMPNLTELAVEFSASRLAECCLRCFVSNQIPQVCYSLEQHFGAQGQFCQADLFPYVLEDADPLQVFDRSANQSDRACPLAVTIVRKFDPALSRLSTWTKLLTRQHKELDLALKEIYGIYLTSDWAILNQATSQQIQRLLSSQLAQASLQRTCEIFQCYQAIYRRDYLQWRSQNPGKRCPEPTPQQLEQMLQMLQAKGIWLTPLALLEELHNLAKKLRPPHSGDLTSIENIALKGSIDRVQSRIFAQQQSSEDEQQQTEFLHRYQQVAYRVLEQVVEQVIDQRMEVARRSRRSRSQPLPKEQAYLKAMVLFHHRRQSMTEIAPQVGLTAQFQVSRLLELQEMAADMRREWLIQMGEALSLLLPDYLEVTQLAQIAQLDRRLENLLGALWLAKIDPFSADAQKNAQKMERSAPFGPEWTPKWTLLLHQRLYSALPQAGSASQMAQIDRQLEQFLAGLEGMINPIIAEYIAETYSPDRTARRRSSSKSASDPSKSLTRSRLSACICRYLESLGAISA